MNNKRFVRIVAIVLAFIMLLSVAMIAITALADSPAGASGIQERINQLRSQKRDLERDRREVQSRINEIEFERAAEIVKKQVLDDRIMITGLEIENVTSIISYYDLLIREKEYEVYLAQGREEEQFLKYRNRVRNMEENGIISYLEIIFGSTSFSDMLARIDFVADIMRADENTYQNLIAARSETEKAKVSLEDTRVEMEEEKAYLEAKEIELQEQLAEAHDLILQMELNIETQKQLREQVIADEARVLRDIETAVAELRAQQERERLARLREQQRAQAAAGGSVASTGELRWPCGGPSLVSSIFGTRRHPVFGDMRFHAGIDISVPHGTVVVAADGGTVVTSTYNSSYGNYVVIDHGNGRQTLYAHLSSRSVSVGAAVSKGQQIGLVGSTGISTGPHLHFEVIEGGSRINPRSRLG